MLGINRKDLQAILKAGAKAKGIRSHYATYGLYQNGRKENRRKSSSIYYGTRPHRCNNGRI